MKKKITQGKIAQKLGTSDGNYSDIKRGRRGISKAMAITINSETGLSFDFIFSKPAKEVLLAAGAIVASKTTDNEGETA